MAVHRARPICRECGEFIEGKYLDQSDRDPAFFICGDTFQGWDYVGHSKVCRGSIRSYLERMGDGEYRVVMSGNEGYIHPLGRDGETYDIKLPKSKQ
jgi:hypothetical protein